MHGNQPLGDHFRAFATTVERDGGTTYATICRAVADDDDVLSLLDGAPLTQRRPLLLLAAVHFLLLSGVEHPWPPSTTPSASSAASRPGPGPRATSPPPSPTSAACTAPSIEELIATRSTQTNEVGRCTSLLPGLCHIAARYGWHEPLSLLDLGTSAGLNLLFDDYAYTYRAADGGDVRTAGVPRARRSPSSAPCGTI